MLPGSNILTQSSTGAHFSKPIQYKRDTLPRPLLVASLPCCFPISHFLQLSYLQVPKVGPDSHYVYVGGCLHEKIRTGASFIPGDFLILYPVYMMTGSFHISLFECTLHVNKLYV